MSDHRDAIGFEAPAAVDNIDPDHKSLILCFLGYREPALRPDLAEQLARIDRPLARETA